MPEWEGLKPRKDWKAPQSKDGYSPQELVPILGSQHFSGKKIRRLIRDGQLKAKKGWGHWAIQPSDVELYIANEKKRQGLA